MKKVVYGLLVLALLVGGAVYAESLLPDDVQEFTNDCGYICYVWPDGSGDCYKCLECEACDECETPNPNPTPNPKPTPDPDPTPEPPKKQKCNSGRGNGSEGDPDCDPGNSGGHNKGGD